MRRADGNRERRLAERLRELLAPGEDEALDRALELARVAGRRRPSPSRWPRLRRRLTGLGAAIGALAIAGLILTPAGASVREWLGDTIAGERGGEPGLTELPASGRLLVSSRPGAWVVDEDGSSRLIGQYRETSWSPNGLFVVAVRGRQLVAVEPDGDPRWSLSRGQPIRDPRWGGTAEDTRIAYRSGRQLRVVAGDGSDDHLLARRVAPLPPSWGPAGLDPKDRQRSVGHLLAYTSASGRVIAHDVDRGRVLWRTAPGPHPSALEWMSDGRLLVARGGSLELLGPRRGRTLLTLPEDAGPAGGRDHPAAGAVERGRIEHAVASPDGRRIAIVRRGAERAASEVESPRAERELILARVEPGRVRMRTVISGPGELGQPVFSPDGEWVLLPWPDLDQWVFIRPQTGHKRIEQISLTGGVGDIARQFDPGAADQPPFPRVEGWCCP